MLCKKKKKILSFVYEELLMNPKKTLSDLFWCSFIVHAPVFSQSRLRCFPLYQRTRAGTLIICLVKDELGQINASFLWLASWLMYWSNRSYKCGHRMVVIREEKGGKMSRRKVKVIGSKISDKDLTMTWKDIRIWHNS